jgi:ferredoxin-NADP reductase
MFIEIFLAFCQTKLKNFGSTFIKEVNLLPSGVTHLVIFRPKYFKFKAGDYIHIQIPVISSTEYHPFTISSAPENEGKYIIIK